MRQRFSVDTHRHYAFTPRCVADWINGLRRYDVTAEEFLDAVAYEAQRIFRDRLVGFAAAADFDTLLSGALTKGFRFQMKPQEPLFASGGGGGDPALKKGQQTLQALSLSRVDPAQFATLAAEKLRLYERENRSLDIHLFSEVLHRVVRFDRVLSAPGGSLLLCGRSGVGRRTTVSLAAYMQRMQARTRIRRALLPLRSAHPLPSQVCRPTAPASRSQSSRQAPTPALDSFVLRSSRPR